MEELINTLSEYGYIILFLYSFGGGFFAIIGAGALASIGKLDIELVILIGATSNFIGDTFLFYFARNYKSEVMNYVREHRRKLALSHILMKKHGNSIILFQKFLYGVKTLVPIAIGLTKYDFTKFTIINLLSSIVWGLAFGLLSYLGGSYIIDFFKMLYENSFVMPLIAITLFWILWKYLSSK
ncbi:MAG: DedA family protein [Campylobacterales bacterium]|nr:DedA family protein [Campylobacterales bacterium]